MAPHRSLHQSHRDNPLGKVSSRSVSQPLPKQQNAELNGNMANLEMAKKFFKAKEYQQTEEWLMKTIWYCECNDTNLQNVPRHARSMALKVDPVNPCFCKNLLAQARRSTGVATSLGGNGSVLTARLGPGGIGIGPSPTQNLTELDTETFRQTLAQPCCCGSGQGTCASDIHLMALDGLALLSMAKHQSRQALEYAFRMMNLASTKGEGYIRAAWVLKPEMPISGVAEGDVLNMRRCVIKHGQKNVDEALPRQSKILRNLTHQHLQLSRKDIVGLLPPELTAKIIGHLTPVELINCRAVSKGWRKLLDSDEKFWVCLDLGNKLPRRLMFRGMMTTWGRGKVQKLVLRNTGTFSAPMMCDLWGSAHSLRHLELHGLDHRRYDSMSAVWLSRSAFKNLIRFELSQLAMYQQPNPYVDGWYQPILNAAADTLECLDLSNICAPSLLMLPRMARVKYIRLAGTTLSSNRSLADPMRSLRVHMDVLFDRLPNVEHLYLDRCMAEVGDSGDDNHIRPPRSLSSVVLEEGVTCKSEFFLRLNQLLQTNSLRSLDVLSSRAAAAFSLWLVAYTTSQELRLEHFRCAIALPVASIRAFLDSSVRSGSLRSLLLQLPMDVTSHTHLDDLMQHPIGVDTVTTLGLQNFMFRSTAGSYISEHSGKPFLDLVARYPNVTTVSAYPEMFVGADNVIIGLIEMAVEADAGKPVPRIRTIYQSCLSGMARDRAMACARAAGVQIIHTTHQHMPPGFPWPDDV